MSQGDGAKTWFFISIITRNLIDWLSFEWSEREEVNSHWFSWKTIVETFHDLRYFVYLENFQYNRIFKLKKQISEDNSKAKEDAELNIYRYS